MLFKIWHSNWSAELICIKCFYGLRCRIKSADEKYQSEHLEPLLSHIVVVLQETIIVFVIGAEICASKFAGAVDQLDHDIRFWTNRDMHQRLGICQRLLKQSQI